MREVNRHPGLEQRPVERAEQLDQAQPARGASPARAPTSSPSRAAAPPRRAPAAGHRRQPARSAPRRGHLAPDPAVGRRRAAASRSGTSPRPAADCRHWKNRTPSRAARDRLQAEHAGICPGALAALTGRQFTALGACSMRIHGLGRRRSERIRSQAMADGTVGLGDRPGRGSCRHGDDVELRRPAASSRPA